MSMNVAIAKELKHVILLGASVGHAWDIEKLPHRVNNRDFMFEFAGEYEFDKSKELKKILQRTTDKADAVILKECAAYFPGNFEKQKKLMEEWINKLQEKNIVPIPATVVPVTTPKFLSAAYFKNLLKRYIYKDKIPMEAKLKYILEYNDWIKQYSKERGLTVLDLEGALRINDSDRRLRPDLTSGDGLHLNKKAYSIIDNIVVSTLSKAFEGKR